MVLSGFTSEGSRIRYAIVSGAWPTQTPLIYEERVKEGGVLKIEVGVWDRVRVSFIENNTALLVVVTGRIVCVDDVVNLTIGITWDRNRKLLVYVNGVRAGSSCDPLMYLRLFVCRARSIDEADVVDYSDKNVRALSRREGRYLKVSQPKPGTRLANPTYVLESLNLEMKQLGGLLRLVRDGEVYHARGIAGKLRLLLHRQGQVPLMQSSAALTGSELIIYTSPVPEYVSALEPDVLILISNISAVETELLFNPVDLDVWLGFPSIKIGKTLISHEGLIGDLGNTIGNHLDPNILPSVDLLNAQMSGHGETLEDALTHHIVAVAEAVLVLGTQIIGRAKGLNLLR